MSSHDSLSSFFHKYKIYGEKYSVCPAIKQHYQAIKYIVVYYINTQPSYHREIPGTIIRETGKVFRNFMNKLN